MDEFTGRVENVEEKCDEIWIFVEKKINLPIPTYFKNTLKACGYNNGITIATIEDDDIDYIESEVRNGNVATFFAGDQRNLLEGSGRCAKDFVFSMGHKKFLLSIAHFLKKHIEENGPDSFISEVLVEVTPKPKPKLKSLKTKSGSDIVPKKKMKYSPEASIDHSNVDKVSIEIGYLLSKALLSLVSHTPEMYVKAVVKDIETKCTKVSTDLVAVEIGKSSSETLNDETIAYFGNITCPFCSKVVPVSHSSIKRSSGCSGKPWWNTSNFDRHLYTYHKRCPNLKGEKHTEYRDENNYSHNMNELSTRKPPSDSRESVKTEEHLNVNDSNSILHNFVKSAERNAERKKPGYRYDDLTKMFAAFLKMIAGLLAYEMLHANFPLSLPSVSTVNRYLADNGPQVVEGEMRTDELLQYLNERNLPLEVCLSEDGTRTTAKISYDPKTNQLIGYSLPLDTNGMPKTSSFPARNVREIQNHFKNTSNSVSSYAYVQMAQPIEPNAPPFCFMIYSTDNKFTALHVLKRWRFQARTLKEKGIKIKNISTDGDSRCLMAMKVLSRIGQSDRSYLDCEWYSCGGYLETTFTQDMTHILTKLRNLLLKLSRIFPIGNKIISSCHLKYLIENVSKDKHLLTRTDIEPKDRQNFLSADKICSERTIKCLQEYVPGCEGTVIYLQIMRSVLDSFSDTKLKSTERLYLIFYAVFFCRGWRSWLLNSEKTKTAGQNRPKSFYNLKQNFMSSNCYTCIELNAHSLVKQVLIEDPIEDSCIDDSNEGTGDEHSAEELSCSKDKIFFANIFSSQVCESMFRQIRSFTSTFCTIVNFTMLDIIHRIRKIQLMNDIINACNGNIKFPRFERKAADMSERLTQGFHRLEGLNRKTIISEIEKAKTAVVNDLEKLGINTSELNFHCQVNPVFEENLMDPDCELDSELDSDSEEMELRNKELAADFLDVIAEEEDHEDINFLSGITGELMLKDYSNGHEYFDEDSGDYVHLNEKSPFVLVTNNGKAKVVRKSAVCYVLCKNKHKLSSDRLQRVQEKDYTMNTSINKAIPDEDKFIVNEEIDLGDWCVFSDGLDSEIVPTRASLLIGLVLGFAYLKKNTFKEREYSKAFAPVQSHPNNSVGVSCSLYNFDEGGILQSALGDKHTFFKIETYVGTIKKPIFVNNKLSISQNLVRELHQFQVS